MFSIETDNNIHFAKDPLATFIQKRYIKDEQKSFSLTFYIHVYNISSEKNTDSEEKTDYCHLEIRFDSEEKTDYCHLEIRFDSEEKTDYCHLEIRFGDYISKLRLFEHVLNHRTVFTPSYNLLFVCRNDSERLSCRENKTVYTCTIKML